MGEIEVAISRDPVATAAAYLCKLLRERIATHGYARLAIPGGSAAAVVAPVRHELGEAWRRVRLTWVDERCVAFDSPASNRGRAYASGALGREDSPAVELELFADGESAAQAVARVEAALGEQFGGELDLVLLGMGADGHVASLFPSQDPLPGLVAHVSNSPKPPAARVTLTRAMLATAAHTVLVVTGEEKRSALRRLVQGDASLPATGLPGLVVFTDLNGDEERR